MISNNFFFTLPQPTAPSETLPFKSGIKITRKPIATSLIPVAEIVAHPNDGEFVIRSEPSTSTPIKPSTSAQTEDHDDPSVHSEPSNQDEAIVILDFSNVLPTMPKNVYTEFYDIFPVEQPDIKKLNKKEKKAYDAQQIIYRKRKWEHIGRNMSQAEKEAKKAKAKALKEGYVMGDDGKTQFTIKAYMGSSEVIFGGCIRWL